jgi:thiamine-phosphate pyrophosphorylase
MPDPKCGVYLNCTSILSRNHRAHFDLFMLRYAITDRTQFGPDETVRRAALVDSARRWATAGIDFIQLREKDLPAGDLVGLARDLSAAIRQTGSITKLLINSSADEAIAAGASGVHLASRAGQLTPAQVRVLFNSASPKPVTSFPITISVSCHTLEEVAFARARKADLILFGPVFDKVVQGRSVAPGTGLDQLRSACVRAGDTPVLALGGITAQNTAACLAAGAAGIAAIRLFSAPWLLASGGGGE